MTFNARVIHIFAREKNKIVKNPNRLRLKYCIFLSQKYELPEH